LASDGKWVLGSSALLASDRISIVLFPLSAAPHAETQARAVASKPGYNLWQGRFSPDGRWICFNAIKRVGVTGSTLYVVPTSGGEWVQITEENAWADKPRWSPDGRTIYFLSSRAGFLNVWGRRFDPARGQPVGEPFQVTSFENPGRRVWENIAGGELSVSKDRLVLCIANATGSIWMLEGVDR